MLNDLLHPAGTVTVRARPGTRNSFYFPRRAVKTVWAFSSSLAGITIWV